MTETTITITECRIVAADLGVAETDMPPAEVERLRAALAARIEADLWRQIAGGPPAGNSFASGVAAGALKPAPRCRGCGPFWHRAGCPSGAGVT